MQHDHLISVAALGLDFSLIDASKGRDLHTLSWKCDKVLIFVEQKRFDRRLPKLKGFMPENDPLDMVVRPRVWQVDNADVVGIDVDRFVAYDEFFV